MADPFGRPRSKPSLGQAGGEHFRRLHRYVVGEPLTQVLFMMAHTASTIAPTTRLIFSAQPRVRASCQWQANRRKPDHLRNPDRPRARPVAPMHGGDLPPGTLRAIIRQAGLSVREFLDLL